MHLAQIPGFSEALAAAMTQEADSRDYAWLDLPKKICGIQVVQMTLRQYLRLVLLRNPAVCCREVPDPKEKLLPPDSIAQFLWLLSPHYMEPYRYGLSVAQASARKSQASRRRNFFVRSIALHSTSGKLQTGIRDYMAAMLYDAPGSDGNKIPTTSFAGVFTDLICSEYGGMSIDDVLDSPLPRLYQAMRRIILRKNPKYPIINKATGKVQREFAAKAFRQSPVVKQAGKSKRARGEKK